MTITEPWAVTAANPAYGVSLNVDGWAGTVKDADGVILAIDPRPAALAQNRDHVAWLAALAVHPRKGAVVVTKMDIVLADPTETAAILIGSSPFGAWPVFGTRSDRPDTLVRPFDALIDQLAPT